MATHIDLPISMAAMKTTLLRAARKVATRENTTLRALVEQGLRQVVAEKKKDKPFRLRNASFKGNGLHPDVAGKSWSGILDLSYEGRGS